VGDEVTRASLAAINSYRGYLMDTHTFLWAVKNPRRLGVSALAIIENPDTRLFLSSISAFEVAYKQQTNKLDPTYENVVKNYTQYARLLGAEDLPLALAHTFLAGSMEWDHKDPFDRFIVAQASLENLAIITNDVQIQAHPWVDVIW